MSAALPGGYVSLERVREVLETASIMCGTRGMDDEDIDAIIVALGGEPVVKPRKVATVTLVGHFWDAPNWRSDTIPLLVGWVFEGGDYPGWDTGTGLVGGWTYDELRAKAAEAGTLHEATR